MPCCMFETCCCCVELRTGCLILGYIELVLIIIIMSLIPVAFIRKDIEETVATIAITITLVSFVFVMLYLVGIYKNKRVYVKAYIIFSVVCLALSLVPFAFQVKHPEVIFKNLISFVLNVYFLLVIRSYYIKMDDDITKNGDINTELK